MTSTLFALGLVLAAFFIALTVLLAFGMVDRRKTSSLRRFSEEERDRVVFIFENEILLDATPAARQFLDQVPRMGTPWTHLATLLSPRFPRLTDIVGDLAEVGELRLAARDGSSHLRAEWHDGITRITLDDANPEKVTTAGFDQHSLLALTRELDMLRASSENTPFPQWREDQGGGIFWCNRAYLTLADNIAGTEDLRPWPPARVFTLEPAGRGSESGTQALYRSVISLDGDTEQHWFEITETELEQGEKLFTAVPTDRLVKAETSLQEFVTTLTKTFAALPIGLVIFDRARELALFNPALMDLTMLSASFLISKPPMSAFLDRLRESRMMPEPKDYKSWRQQMSDLETAARNGTYEETWELPTGQTYRVTGRPHPDGAVALLFEDISAEISVSRRFRTEIETGQAALDALPQAIAVFNSGGQLMISNTAYTKLWGEDPSTPTGEVSFRNALDSWKSRAAPTPAWDEMHALMSWTGRRSGVWRSRITLTDGRSLLTRMTPIARGATLVDFTVAAPKANSAPAPVVRAQSGGNTHHLHA